MADSNFEVHDKTLHCLNIAIQEFTWQKNLVKIGLELSILEPIQQGDFFVPNLGQKMYVQEKILGCPTIGFILFFLKKLLLRIW